MIHSQLSAADREPPPDKISDQQVPWVDFAKGQWKDDVAHEHLARFARDEGVLFIGRALEKPGPPPGGVLIP